MRTARDIALSAILILMIISVFTNYRIKKYKLHMEKYYSAAGQMVNSPENKELLAKAFEKIENKYGIELITMSSFNYLTVVVEKNGDITEFLPKDLDWEFRLVAYRGKPFVGLSILKNPCTSDNNKD